MRCPEFSQSIVWERDSDSQSRCGDSISRVGPPGHRYRTRPPRQRSSPAAAAWLFVGVMPTLRRRGAGSACRAPPSATPSTRPALTFSASPHALVREVQHANAFGEGRTKHEIRQSRCVVVSMPLRREDHQSRSARRRPLRLAGSSFGLSAAQG